MSKNSSIDYGNLDSVIYKKAYRYSEVQDRLERVAFDVVRFKDDDNLSHLWQVQSADDGDYIVSMYEQDEMKVEASSCAWGVGLNKISGDMQFSYKGDPIVRVAGNKLGIPSAELQEATRYLPGKLANSKKLVKSLLNELNESAKNEVLSKYPELF